MALAKTIIVKESVKELKRLQLNKPLTIIKRLNMLLEIKKHGENGISKRDLAKRVGIDPNSAQKWRTIYIEQGINGIIKHGRVGFKPTILTKEEHKKIEHKLNQAKDGLKGYKDLMRWIKEELGTEIKYTTLFEYVRRNFGAKIKVARKTHVKKDDVAVDTFKKTSVKSSKKQFLK
jgi:transposase